MQKQKEDQAFKAELANQREQQRMNKARRAEEEMNQGLGGQMQYDDMGEDEMMFDTHGGRHGSRVPSYGFYNDFDDVLDDGL